MELRSIYGRLDLGVYEDSEDVFVYSIIFRDLEPFNLSVDGDFQSSKEV